MMASSEVADLKNAGEGINNELRIETHKLDTLENGGVNLQCINSSEFMVGKQTNFNGPVTIINCADGKEAEGYQGRLPEKEEVVIKDRIMAPTVAASMENFVKQKAQTEQFQKKNMKSKVKGVCTKSFLKIPVFAWSIVLFIVFAGLVTVITEFYLFDVGELVNLTVNGKTFKFVSRKVWGAVEARSESKLTLPVPYIVISHTGTGTCYTLTQCRTSVQNMQIENINKKKFPDIKYNFLVGGDGLIYEGRGWHNRGEAPGRVNNQNIDIAFIGNFALYVPTKNQTETVQGLIEYALLMNYTIEDYSLIPANMTLSTVSPGQYVIEIIKDWPHYKYEWADT